MSSSKLEKVLIVGAGYVGSSIARDLVKRKYDVTLLSPRASRLSFFDSTYGINFVDGSVLNPDVLNPLVANSRAVINCAGYIDKEGKNPLKSLEVNVGSELSILDAIRRSNPSAHHIYMGTRAQFGKVNTPLPVSESHPQIPNTVYGLHKKMGEDQMILYRDLHGLNTLGFRLVGIYGPSVDGSTQHFLGHIMKHSLGGKIIPWKGGNSSVQDFIFIEDLVSLTAMALEKRTLGVFNVGSGTGDSMKAYAEHILARTGNRSTISFTPLSKEEEFRDLDGSIMDISAISRATGWSPKHNVYDGIDKTLNWMRSLIK